MKKPEQQTENPVQDPSTERASEGPHGERLNEVQIDTEIATRTMDDGHVIDEEEVREAFAEEPKQNQKAPQRNTEEL